MAAHVYGHIDIINDPNELQALIQKTVDFCEGYYEEKWVPEFTTPFIQGLMNGVVEFQIFITKIESKWKLSQNHPLERKKTPYKVFED
ncbi:MAG: hypothetical protein C7B43_20035 [Sulfobacillus benefaciens]|uniref:Uncharacterized protein n=1 Tax=Sulfobacillus benefaciens TaxID=453960 RepID=A0A2T2WMI8_9FIRM|nr:MAG: hypothetical protein C7B43_20035 [Sulfobacillus benefaciens]HBQ95976.1 hypothetical protein [Sulfobacillus sp.]